MQRCLYRVAMQRAADKPWYQRSEKEEAAILWPPPCGFTQNPGVLRCLHVVNVSWLSVCLGWAKPRTSLVSHRPSQSVISWIKWQLPKWLEQDRWMGRGIKGRSGGGKGERLLNKDPCPNTITLPHPNQNHCPWRDTVSTETISVSKCATEPGRDSCTGEVRKKSPILASN